MKAIFPTCIALVMSFSLPQANAQNAKTTKDKSVKSEETIVIDKAKGRTIIEIKDGDVIINGDKVASTDAGNSLRKKIIIHNDGYKGDMPLFIEKELSETGRKAMLGVYTKPADGRNNGAAIDRVMPGSSADKAGLENGDVITHINNQKINNGKELSEAIAQYNAGDNIEISYERDGKASKSSASLSKAHNTIARTFTIPDDLNERYIPNPMVRPFMYDIGDMAMDASPKMGIEAEDIPNDKGVLVTEVYPNSAAAKAGIQKGDIILKMNNETVVSVDDLQENITLSKRNTKIPLEYTRNGKSLNSNIIFSNPVKKKKL